MAARTAGPPPDSICPGARPGQMLSTSPFQGEVWSLRPAAEPYAIARPGGRRLYRRPTERPARLAACDEHADPQLAGLGHSLPNVATLAPWYAEIATQGAGFVARAIKAASLQPGNDRCDKLVELARENRSHVVEAIAGAGRNP